MNAADLRARLGRLNKLVLGLGLGRLNKLVLGLTPPRNSEEARLRDRPAATNKVNVRSRGIAETAHRSVLTPIVDTIGPCDMDSFVP
jgi:hypothetical protein